MKRLVDRTPTWVLMMLSIAITMATTVPTPYGGRVMTWASWTFAGITILLCVVMICEGVAGLTKAWDTRHDQPQQGPG